MLSDLITNLNIRILEFVLNREVSITDISKGAKTTKANAFHVLNKLKSFDVVRKKVQGRSHIYRFNFLHSEAEEIISLFEEKKRQVYNKKLNNLPRILHSFLTITLKENYLGCIFFGSSISKDYNDVDVYILL